MREPDRNFDPPEDDEDIPELDDNFFERAVLSDGVPDIKDLEKDCDYWEREE